MLGGKYAEASDLRVKPVVEERAVMDKDAWRRFNELFGELRKARVEGELLFDQIFEGSDKVNRDVLALLMLMCAKGII